MFAEEGCLVAGRISGPVVCGVGPAGGLGCAVGITPLATPSTTPAVADFRPAAVVLPGFPVFSALGGTIGPSSNVLFQIVTGTPWQNTRALTKNAKMCHGTYLRALLLGQLGPFPGSIFMLLGSRVVSFFIVLAVVNDLHSTSFRNPVRHPGTGCTHLHCAGASFGAHVGL